MIPKQDRQGVRKPMDIEQKYDLNTDFSSIEKIATNAQRTASDAKTTAQRAEMSVSELARSAEAKFTEVNADIGELSESVGIHSDNIQNLDDRVSELEASGAGGGSSARIGEVTLLASGWMGGGNLYSQIVEVVGATENSQVDLTPSIEQLVIFYEKDLTFVTENEDGVVTVYAIGQKPENDYTIQVTITEVIV